MAVQELTFQGINRAITDYAVTGACEELINLRPTTGGLVPVKGFKTIMSDTYFSKIFIHEAGRYTNYIAIEKGTSGFVVKHVDAQGSLIQELFSLPSEISLDNVHFAFTGNIFLCSVCDKDNGKYDNYSFLWNGENYTSINAEIPNVNVTVTLGNPFSGGFYGEAPSAQDSPQQLADKYTAATNAILESNSSMCVGPTIVALAFKTRDGKMFWTRQWFVCDPIPRINTAPLYYNSTTRLYNIIPSNDNHYVIYGTNVKLFLSMAQSLPEDSWIESVEVYASKPVPHYKVESGSMYERYAKNYTNMELDNKLLYFQKSIPLKDILHETQEVTLKFGGNTQTTEKTLQVDAGALTRYGKLLAYNARFHFYDSVANVGISMPDFSFPSSATLYTSEVYVIYNDGQKDVVLYTGTAELPDSIQSVISSPMRVKEVVVLRPDTDQYYHYARYRMLPSQTYNYSICFTGPYDSGTQNGRGSQYAEAYYKGVVDSVIQEEPDALNVTEQYNPFVFNVDHSYLAPGKILDVQPQMVAVRDVTFGDYPLNVFTNRGLYALLQGSGKILYGNFRSISNLISTANSIPTESGTFFLAAGGLWAVAGEKAVLISDALSLGPHMFIRMCAGYKAISNDAYNVFAYESKTPFEEYVKEAVLSYNRFRDELIVSNPGYQYSYVLSLKYRQWFKISGMFPNGSENGQVAFIPDGNGFRQGKAKYYMYGISRFEFTITYSTSHSFPVSRTFTHQYAGLSDLRSALNEWLDANLPGASAVISGASQRYWHEITLNLPENNYSKLEVLVVVYNNSDEEVSGTNLEFSGTNSIVDFSQEETASCLVHLQSRPFSFNGYMYSHIHRIVSMVRTALSTSDLLIAAVYGSDDLQNWTLLSYAGRAGSEEHNPLQISQLRTPPAARSWRYYTVCIGGKVPTDTDFGPVLVDYQPVIRRLG